MSKVTAVQHDFDGKGNDRRFDYWVKPDQVAQRIEKIAQAYNMEHTTIEVNDVPVAY